MQKRIGAGALLATLFAVSAQASPVTFTFAGSINNDPFGVFDSASFTGSYIFDSNTTRVLNTANSGGYAGSGGIFTMSVAFTGTLDPSVNGPFVADGLNITVNNNFPGPLDQYLVTGTSTADPNLSIELTLSDFTGTAFSNTSLPLTAPNLAAFQSVGFALFAGTVDNPIEAEGSLTRLQCTAGCGTAGGVPEPGGLPLFLTGMTALTAARRYGARFTVSACALRVPLRRVS